MSHLLGVLIAQVQVGSPALPESLGIPPTVVNVVMSLVGAIAILLLGWVVAALVSSAVRSLLKRTDLDNRIVDMTAGQQAPSINIEKVIATVVFWIIMILAIVAALNVLNLTTVSQPLNGFLNQIFSYLPRLVGAALLSLAAWILATVSRLVVIRLARSLGLDERVMGEPADELAPARNQFLLSDTLGNVLYWFVFLVFLLLVLDVLNLQGPLTPVQNLLNEFLAALPNIFTAIVILILGYVVGQLVKDLVTNLLTGLGFNNVLSWLGLKTERLSPLPPPPPVEPVGPDSPLLIEPDSGLPSARTPSEVVGIVAMVGIILLAAVAATNVLGIPALTAIVGGILVLLGQVLVGLAIFAVGLYLANLAYNIIATGSAQSKILAQTARIAILAFVIAMALQQIGLAPNIINLAFGLLLGAISVAIALAFGLGGRDVAAEQLREWLANFKRRE